MRSWDIEGVGIEQKAEASRMLKNGHYQREFEEWGIGGYTAEI